LAQIWHFLFLDEKKQKIPGYTGTSFLTGKSQTADSRLQTRLGAWWENVAWGIA
jgi:hypothetical protein